MGLVNAVVPLDRLEEETVAWCREMLALSPFALRLAEGELQRPRGRLRRDPAARPRRQPPLLRAARRRRRGARPTRRSAARTSPTSRAGRERRRRGPPRPASGSWRRARGRSPRRSRPCSSAPRWRRRGGTFKALTFLAALIGALFIQVGTNLSNDYSDARRGADTEDRLGPVRVTAGGLVPPRQVLIATYVAFGVAVLAGVYLIATAGWELLLVGAASILAGVLYTGGPRPYGYEGLGELFVFLFFGVVAVAGSYFAQTEQLAWEAFVLAVPVGLLASAILVVNNVRDLETDRRAGKRTLAVRLGRERRAMALRGVPRGRVPGRAAAVAARVAVAVAVPQLAGDPAGAAGDPRGAHADGRAVAQRRPGGDRTPAAGVLRAPLRGPAGKLNEHAECPACLALRDMHVNRRARAGRRACRAPPGAPRGPHRRPHGVTPTAVPPPSAPRSP